MSKKQKQRKQTPIEGDTIKLKGRMPSGVLKKITPYKWCLVDWRGEEKGPKFCHLYEIEKI